MSKSISASLDQEMKSRLTALQALMSQRGIDVYLIEDPTEIYYFTRQRFSSARLWVARDRAILFVDARYIEAAQKGSYIQPCVLLSKESEKELFRAIHPKVWGCDASLLCYSRVEDIRSLLQSFQCHKMHTESLTRSLRMIKGKTEMRKMRNSASLLTQVFTALLTKVRSQMKEKELANIFEILLREMGAEAAAFEPIIAFGANSAMPHHRAGSTKLQKGDMILFDLGLVLDGYHSDMTRVVFHGRPDPFLAKLCGVVRASHQAALSVCRPGVKVGMLDVAAREVMKQYGLESYFTHSLGHGIGLSTHEDPRVRFDSKDKDILLSPGMVITIEPGLYVPGRGGVRWEDMVLITPNGHMNMTKAV